MTNRIVKYIQKIVTNKTDMSFSLACMLIGVTISEPILNLMNISNNMFFKIYVFIWINILFAYPIYLKYKNNTENTVAVVN